MSNEDDEILDDISKFVAYTGIGLSALGILFYPVEEVGNVTETDLGFIPTVSKVITGLGLLTSTWEVIMLYNKHVNLPTPLKWILIPLLILDVLLLAILVAVMLGLKKLKIAGNFVSKYLQPAVFSLGGAGLIIGMAVFPEYLLKTSWIGKIIHYLPAGLGYAPINKHPFYAIVILVRTGGLITATAGSLIEEMTENK